MKILYTNFHYGDGGGHTTYIVSLARALHGQHTLHVAAPADSRLLRTMADEGIARTLPIAFGSGLPTLPRQLAEQRALIRGATELLVATGAPHPIAFRAGSYSANADTLCALAELGFVYDASHNGGEHPWPSAIDLPAAQIAPLRHRGVIEVPVTLIEEKAGALRNFQICALSAGEMRAALDHALDRHHAAVTIVSHGFELANRAGTRPNAVHVRRFEALCALLAERATELPTMHFADRPELRLGQYDVPLGPDPLRTRWRLGE